MVYWYRASISIGFEIFASKYICATTLTFQGHMTSPVTCPFDTEGAIFFNVRHCTRVCISSHFRDDGPKYIAAMTFTFQDHVTSSVTQPFDLPSYIWSVIPNLLSVTAFEIFDLQKPVRAHTQTDTRRCK